MSLNKKMFIEYRCPYCNHLIYEQYYADKNEPKKVNLYYDWGVLVPHCPECDEIAYEPDKCVFCGQPFIFTPKPKPDLKVNCTKLWAVMPSKTSIYVFELVTGALVCHETVNGKWDKKKLKEHLKSIEESFERIKEESVE